MKKATDKLKNNYIVIQSWMVRELGLKGNRLTVYAIVYGFSQTEKQACTCGVEYLQAWTNSSKQGVLNTLESLVNDGFIERINDFGGDKRKTAYRVIGQQSLPIFTEKKGKESLPNFIENNVDNSKIGQQSLPKSGEIGKESLPKNRSTFFRATYNKNNLDVKLNNNINLLRAREEWQEIVDKRCNLELAKECCISAYGDEEIYNTVINTLLDVLVAGNDVIVGDKVYEYEIIVKSVEEMERNVFAEIESAFCQIDRETNSVVKKKISNPTNYIVTLLMAKRQ